MSRLSRIAVSKRSVTLLFAAALFVAGISSWGSLKQELLPDIEFPVITVVTPYPGAGSSDVLEQVTRPIERTIGAIPRLELIQSTSSNSISLVVTQFAFGTDVPKTTQEIEDALAKANLPTGTTPAVQALNINAAPVVISSIAATSPDGLEAAAEIARREIVPEVSAIDGVARADLTGGLETRLAITLDPAKLAASNVSADQIVGVLKANNLTLPSGQIDTDGSKTPVSTIGRLTTAEQVRSMVVGTTGTPPNLTPVTIGSLGTVELESIATTGYGRTNGQPALTLTVSKTSNANTVEVADAVQAKLAEIGARHTDVMTITTVQDLSTFIKESRDGLLREGGLGAVFAVITIFLFLFSIRATLVAAISIPLSILTALVVMQLTGVTINIMTLGGLAVAVGRVVDDAIVVLENIYRHRSLGEDRLAASINGPREVAGAITASTLTTVAVFLPLGFVGGLVSQFFLPFALTVTFALLASLACALTVVPVLAYLLIRKVDQKVDEHGEPTRSIWVRGYTPIIRGVLRSRWTALGVVGLAAVLFVASTALAPLLPTQFINAGSEKTLVVTIAPPAGAGS
ncbi:MAG TPA: efflux RND transporter permease subunit, partial [Actinomycetota bacterium]|nr:efflux RND transporter permease subunit [Actinomycetota bacterium]